MTSWVQCKCGESLNKNLFSGNGLFLLVHEEKLDKEPIDEKDINEIVIQSEILKKCPNCGCVIIINDQSGDVKYFKEVSVEDV